MWKVTWRNNDVPMRLFSWAPAQQDGGGEGINPQWCRRRAYTRSCELPCVWRAGPISLTMYKYPWSLGALVDSIGSSFAKSENKLSTMKLSLCLLLVILAVHCYEGEYHLRWVQPQLLVSLLLWTVGKFMCDKVSQEERSKISSSLFF